MHYSVLVELSDKPIPFVDYKFRLADPSRASEITRLLETTFIEHGMTTLSIEEEIESYADILDVDNEQRVDDYVEHSFDTFFGKGWKKGQPGGTYISSEEDESTIVFEPYNMDNTWMCFAETPKSFHGSRYQTHDTPRPSIQFTLT